MFSNCDNGVDTMIKQDANQCYEHALICKFVLCGHMFDDSLKNLLSLFTPINCIYERRCNYHKHPGSHNAVFIYISWEVVSADDMLMNYNVSCYKLILTNMLLKGLWSLCTYNMSTFGCNSVFLWLTPTLMLSYVHLLKKMCNYSKAYYT